MELTETERALVLAHRRKLEEEARPEVSHLLKTASEYFSWLVENGLGSTFSTFCNDFEYEGEGSRDRIYQEVMDVIRFAKARNRNEQ